MLVLYYSVGFDGSFADWFRLCRIKFSVKMKQIQLENLSMLTPLQLGIEVITLLYYTLKFVQQWF